MASIRILLYSEVITVLYNVFNIVSAEYKDRNDPIAALILFLFLSGMYRQIAWNLKSVHNVLSLARTSILDSKRYYTSLFGLDAPVQREMDPHVEQTKNCTTNVMVEKIQTIEGQGGAVRSATQPCDETVHIKEVKKDIKKFEKEKSVLRLRTSEKKDQPKFKQQKLKHEIPDVEQTKFKIDVQQQQHTAQQRPKADRQRLNKNQEQLKTAPEEKTCNTTQTNTKGLNELHHLEEPPTTQSFNTHVYTNDQKQGHCGVKIRNTRSINMRGVNEMQHLGEQYSLHNHDTKFHINDQERALKEKAFNALNTRPMNSKQNNEQTEFEKDSQEQPETNHDDQYLEQLQREGKVCSKNCVLCTILWSCQKKLGFYICGLQLMLLLFLHAVEKIQREDLKCEKFMEIFMKCGVTEELEDEEYEWFDDESSKMTK